MILNRRVFHPLTLSLFVPISIFLSAGLCSAQFPVLKLQVKDTAVVGNQYQIPLPVYLSNYEDTVAAFDIKLAVDRPDLVRFYDTVVTEGSLMSEWELVASILHGENSDTLQLIGMADLINPSKDVPGIGYPDAHEQPLAWVLVDVLLPPDSQSVPTVIDFVTQSPYDFIISDEDGHTVGLTLDTLYDTLWFACEVWHGETCLSWALVEGPPADSFYVDLSLQVEVDTNLVKLIPGGVDLGWHLCGDVTGDENRVNLADITFLISMVYLDGDSPAVVWSANVDGSPDGRVNLADITMLISHVYIDGIKLNCNIVEE